MSIVNSSLVQKNNIVDFPFKENNNIKKFSTKKLAKDGSVKKTKCNKIAGESSEVYAFKTKEELNAMYAIFDAKIKNAVNPVEKYVARRNKLLFAIGTNIGIRGSDLRTLKWSFFFDEIDSQLVYKPFYVIQPIKQRKQNKFVTMFFNNSVKTAIDKFISFYPINDLNDYIFKSNKGGTPISTHAIWDIIKNVAEEAGIRQNIGAHSLRKTFGYWCWHTSNDKTAELVRLQQAFNHSSTLVTMKYIGVLNDELEVMYNRINVGLEHLQDW